MDSRFASFNHHGRRSPWTRRLLAALLGPALLFGGLWLVPTPYYITAPGAAVDTERLIAVPGGKKHDGRLYMLALMTNKANALLWLYGKADPRADLETREQFLGALEDYEGYVRYNQELMRDSQRIAKAIALQITGYGAGIRPVGARVSGLVGGSPAKGVLEPGDVILAVAGRSVGSLEDLHAAIQELARPGVPLELGIRRAGGAGAPGVRDLVVRLVPGEHPNQKGRAYLGVLLLDELVFDEPIPVEITAGLIYGPSAGLMFTLQIIDQLSPGGIGPGRTIAGTGTIERDGGVGAIGGVRQKVFTAEGAGAEVIFVPRANYEDARRAATRITVVAVDNVRDALAWLRQTAR